ncbi:MAG: Beta-galactosidase C-terminal domain [Kiritimatiellia bacterium]
MKGGKPWLLMESCPDSPQWIPTPKPKRPGVYRTHLPQGVSAQVRTDGITDFLFIQNFSKESREVRLDSREYQCMESGKSISGVIELPLWETRVLRR